MTPPSQKDSPEAVAASLMQDFAKATGLDPVSDEPRRYLWTDAFVVCNYLGMYQSGRDSQHLDLALRLCDQVHHVLGRHRSDDERRGWISGLDEESGETHPTAGGLRIGKPNNERGEDEPPDEEAEWEQDGQYFHYLTKWMHALVRVARITGDAKYVVWAAELAKRAQAAFTYTVPVTGERRMRWKMSIDLSRPLVSSMGQHDALDGYITYVEIQTALEELSRGRETTDLRHEMADMATICRGTDLLSDDPLGIGGLLSDASRVCQLVLKDDNMKPQLAERMLDAASTGLGYFREGSTLGLPAEHRLAFRELGLAIGIKATVQMREVVGHDPSMFSAARRLPSLLDSLSRYTTVASQIERFWIDERHRKASTWLEHREINTVMLATCIMPDSFLEI